MTEGSSSPAQKRAQIRKDIKRLEKIYNPKKDAYDKAKTEARRIYLSGWEAKTPKEQERLKAKGLAMSREADKSLPELESLKKEIDQLYEDLGNVTGDSGRGISPIDQNLQNPFKTNMPLPGNENRSDTSKHGNSLNTQLPSVDRAPDPQTGMPQSNSLLLSQQGNAARNILSNDSVSVPQYKAPQVSQIFPLVDPDPDRANNDDALPPLVRLDGQSLKGPDVRYPAMSYRENEHETWPDWAVERATKRYPDLPKWIDESRKLVPDRPEDLEDPDYFELPENPNLRDAWFHGQWKQKKAGQLYPRPA